MQNKFIIFLIILFHLMVSKVYSDDQINFDVTEIEVLENGNRIIGKKRGTINTNNGISIQADEFIYDKTKNIITANGNIKIEDIINNYNFFAQNVIYYKNNELIELKGKTEAIINNNYKFKSENISLFRNEMIISSDVGATILDNLNQTRYEIGKFSYSFKEEILKGEKIFINTKYNQPFSDKFFLKVQFLILKIRTILLKI